MCIIRDIGLISLYIYSFVFLINIVVSPTRKYWISFDFLFLVGRRQEGKVDQSPMIVA